MFEFLLYPAPEQPASRLPKDRQETPGKEINLLQRVTLGLFPIEMSGPNLYHQYHWKGGWGKQETKIADGVRDTTLERNCFLKISALDLEYKSSS